MREARHPSIPGDRAALRERLRQGHAAALREHGPMALPFEVFEEEVLARARRRLARAGVEASAERLQSALGSAALSDLYLAIACDRGGEPAWRELLGRELPRVRALLRARGATAAQAGEITDDVPGLLLASPSAEGRSLLATYDGSGSLFGWLSAIALRRLYRLREAAGRQTEAADLELREAPASGPVALVLDTEAEARCQRAMDGVWPRLSEKQRAVLVHKFVEGRQQTEIAALVGVGPPRVSRLLDAAVKRIRAALQAEFPEPEWRDLPRFWQALRAAVQARLAIPGASPHDSRAAERNGHKTKPGAGC